MGALDDIGLVNLHSVTIGVFENVNRPEAIYWDQFRRQVEGRISAFDMSRGSHTTHGYLG